MKIKHLAAKFRLWADVLEELHARKYLTDDVEVPSNESDVVADKIRRRIKKRKYTKRVDVTKHGVRQRAAKAGWTPERREKQRKIMAKMRREGRGVFSKAARAKNLKARRPALTRLKG